MSAGVSRKTYECFVCQKNGFEGVQVLLGGKDERGRTKYLEPDGTKHFHKSADVGTDIPAGVPGERGVQQQVPFQQQAQQSKDIRIEQYHQENREDREAYRNMYQKDIDAKLELASSERELAAAIRSLALAIERRGTTGLE